MCYPLGLPATGIGSHGPRHGGYRADVASPSVRGDETPANDRPREETGVAARHRVLVVSADMGGGHEATARALEEEITRRWPGSAICRVDTLDVMASWVGRLFRRIYVSNVETTPWLYEFFYSSLWRRRWFAEASKRFTGTWSGRRLIATLDRFDPDVIVSTYPLGSSGLAWLRRHRGLSVPTAAWVSDFAPHPFWVYRDIDVTVVLHESAALTARAAEPGARVVVGPPPAVAAFHPGDRDAARAAAGFAPDRFGVLVSCGSYAFGDTLAVVTQALDAADQVQVVAVCGRNEAAYAALQALDRPASRLTVLGWTDQMPNLIRGADVVLTNAGGATAVEALASATAVLMYDPIAAHGVANADLMVLSGLAGLVADADRLADWLRAAITDRGLVAELAGAAQAHLARTDLADPLAELARVRLAPSAAGRRLRPADALFAQVDQPALRQELGVVCVVEPGRAGPSLVAEVGRRMADVAVGLSALRREPVGQRRPHWRVYPTLDPAAHVGERTLPSGSPEAERWAAVEGFWSEPLPRGRPAWQARLVSTAGGATLVAFKLHHSVADGISALTVLEHIFEADRPHMSTSKPAGAPPRRRISAAVVSGLTSSSQLLRGLVSLAAHGTAPQHPMTRPPASGGHQLVPWTCSVGGLRDRARTLRVHPQELWLAVLATALGDLLRPDLAQPGHDLRTMVSVTLRPPRLDRVFGNWTGTLALDLPLSPMPISQRTSLISARLRRQLTRGEPWAGAAALRVAGSLPAGLPRAFARAVYGRRFFGAAAAYLPGPRGARRLVGAPVQAVFPVLPLAPGAPVAVGATTSGGRVCVGLHLDPALGLSTAEVRAALQRAWDQTTEPGLEPVHALAGTA